MPSFVPKKRFFVIAAILAVFFYLYSAAYEVPILMYHHVDDAKNSSISVSPETFERQMEFLKIHHYRVMGLEELIEKLKAGKRIPMNTVVITFDDGYLDNFTNAFPVLKKMNFSATIFMISDNVGREGGWMSEEDLRILDDGGLTIGSHTVHHTFLPDVKIPEEMAYELTESKKKLENILGHPVTLFSYPAGGVNSTAERLVHQAGYEGAVTTNYGPDHYQLYALHRVKVTESGGGLFGFWAKVSGLYNLGKKRIPIE